MAIEFATAQGRKIHAAAMKWAAAENRISATAYYEPYPIDEDGAGCGWDDRPSHVELYDPHTQHRIRATVGAVLGGTQQWDIPENMTIAYRRDEYPYGKFASQEEAQEAANRGDLVIGELVPKDWYEGTDRDWSYYETSCHRSFGERLLLPDGELVKLLSRPPLR